MFGRTQLSIIIHMIIRIIYGLPEFHSMRKNIFYRYSLFFSLEFNIFTKEDKRFSFSLISNDENS